MASNIDYGMMRMLALISEGTAFRYAVLRCVEEACAWLRYPACDARGSPQTEERQ